MESTTARRRPSGDHAGALLLPLKFATTVRWLETVAMAVVISPVFLLSKSRRHFLTVGYTDEQGQQQAMVFRVDKNSIRATLVALEARTGLKIQYQDQEARKAGK